MAFSDGTLDRISGANSDAGTLWIYKEDNTIFNMRSAGYFDEAAANHGLRDEDLIVLVSNNNIGISQFSVSAAGVVTENESITST